MDEQEIIEKKEARKEALHDVKMWLSNDYNLKEETPEYFVLTKNKSTFFGHILVFIFTVWFTYGLGNIIYYLLSNSKKKIIK